MRKEREMEQEKKVRKKERLDKVSFDDESKKLFKTLIKMNENLQA